MTPRARRPSVFSADWPPAPQDIGWRTAAQAAGDLGLTAGRVRQLLLAGEVEPNEPWYLHGVKLGPGPQDPWIVHESELARYKRLPGRAGQ